MEGAFRARTAVLFAALVFVMFWGLGGRGLFEPDEGRYSEIPREMLESGDFVTPRLNYVKYFEKPPLAYWMSAASFKVFGFNDFAARFPTALLAAGGLVITWLLARRELGRDAADWSVLILGSSILYFALGQIVLTDMPLSFFMTAAFAAAWFAAKGGRPRAARVVFYAAMALGLLAKGLVAIVLPVGVVVCWAIAARDLRPLAVFASPAGLAVFAAVGVPWFWLVCERNPDFFYFFFVQEHFLRYATRMHDRYEPFWYFFPVIIIGLLPWIGVWPSAIADWVRGARGALRARWRGAGTGGGDDGDFLLYLLAWCVVVVGFFSLSSSKLIPYILPALPPIAILMGRAVALRMKEPARLGAMMWCGALSLGLLSTALLVAAYLYSDARYDMVLARRAVMTMALSLDILVLVWLMLAKPGRERRLAPAFLAGALVFCFAVGLTADVAASRKSIGGIAPELVKMVRPDDIVANYRDYMQALPFYLKRRVMLVNYVGELEFGMKVEPGVAKGWFVGDAEFERIWSGDRRVVLVIENADIPSLPDYIKGSMKVEATDRTFSALVNAKGM